MNILIIGSGAREHAMAKALLRSPQKPRLYCCGNSYNPGLLALCEAYWVGNLSCLDEVLEAALKWGLDLVLIGPLAPLKEGLADALNNYDIPTVGPTQKLAQIETSNSFARQLLQKHAIAGAPLYRIFHDLDGVEAFLKQLGNHNYVIKANHLTLAKPVKLAGEHLQTLAEAYHYCETLVLEKQSFLIEEKLEGQTFSLVCVSDGSTILPLPLVQTYKRAFTGNQGPQTPGMGSYSASDHRLPFLKVTDIEAALHINQLTLKALQSEFNASYQGIFSGRFIATKDGVQVLKFSARLGELEALNLLAILDCDFVGLCQALVKSSLSQEKLSFAPFATVCKLAASEGYPEHPLKNTPLDLSSIQNQEQLYIASLNKMDNKLYSTSAHAFAFVGIADNLIQAEKLAEEEMQRARGRLFHRKDIGTYELIEASIRHMQNLRHSQVETV